MHDFFIFVLIIGGIALVGFIAYLARLAEKERRGALASLARRLGWIFDPTEDPDHDEQYAHFGIFRRGHSRAAYNTLTGKLEILGRSCPANAMSFRRRWI